MPEITLVAWIVTVAIGGGLAALWIGGGGMRQAQDEGEVAERRKGVQRDPGREARRPAEVRDTEPLERPGVSLHRLVPHAALALAGLALWTGYVVRQGEPGMRLLPLLALIILLVVAGFGAAMFLRWLPSRRTGHPAREAERRLPMLLVAVHGLAAVTTLVLVTVVVAMETWPLFDDALAGVRDPELDALVWMAGWAVVGAAIGGVLHLAFGRRREARSLGTTMLLTTIAAVVGGGIGYFLLTLSGPASLVLALGGALVSSWGRTFGYAVSPESRA